MSRGEERGAPIEEESSLLDHAKQLCTDALGMITQTFHENRQKALALLAVGSAALGSGVAIEMLSIGEADAAASRSSQACEKYDKNTLSFSKASKDVLPLANKVVSVYHDTNRSEVEIKKNQPELYGLTNRHLTEVDITVPAKLTSGEEGLYTYAAQFSGKITSKDLVLFDAVSYKYKSIGVARIKEGIYNFFLAKTNGTSVDPHEGQQWRMARSYVKALDEDYLVISKLAKDSELPGLYSMTAPILSASIRQAEGVLKDMTRGDITDQKNLDASMPAVMICN